MVEVDCDGDELLRVVTLPEEIRQDRDERGHFLIYDERFVRRHGDHDRDFAAGHPTSCRRLRRDGRADGWVVYCSYKKARH